MRSRICPGCNSPDYVPLGSSRRPDACPVPRLWPILFMVYTKEVTMEPTHPSTDESVRLSDWQYEGAADDVDELLARLLIYSL